MIRLEVVLGAALSGFLGCEAPKPKERVALTSQGGKEDCSVSSESPDCVKQVLGKVESQRTSDTSDSFFDTFEFTLSTLPQLNTSNAAKAFVSGVCRPDGSEVTVRLEGVVHATAMCVDNSWITLVDGTSFPDGDISISADVLTLSGLTKTVSGVLVKDIVMPSVTLTTPLAAITSANVSNYSFAGTCSDEGKLVTVPAPINGSATCVGGVWTVTKDLTAVTDGSGALVVSHTDAGGNTATAASANYVKDTVGPVVTVASLIQANATTSAGANLIVSGKTVDVGVGIDHTEVSISNGTNCLNTGKTAFDAACPNWHSAGATSSWSLTAPKTSFMEGSYTASIRAVDLQTQMSTTHTSELVYDTTLPTISALTVNNGDTNSNLRTVNMAITASDAAGSGLVAVRFAEVFTTCAAAYTDLGWIDWDASATSYPFTTSLINGDKTICAWVKDRAGNVSAVSAAGAGTLGTDKAAITVVLDPPPVITSFTVTNESVGSGSDFSQGDHLRLNWTVTAAAGLPTYPIAKIEYSTDGSTWASILSSSQNNTVFGSTTAGSGSWSGQYSYFVAATTAPIQFRIFADDQSQSRSFATSDVANAGRWSVWAGKRGLGDGASAMSALIGVYTGNYTQSQFIVSHKTGDIFVFETNYGLRRVNAKTGIVDLVMPINMASQGFTLFGYSRVAQDRAGYVYLYAYKIADANKVHIVRFDPAQEPFQLESYVGGGSNYTADSAASQLKIIETSPLVFDGNNNLYLFSGSVSDGANIAFRLFKITRDGVAADQALLLAGTSSYAAHTNGQDANTQPLQIRWMTITSLAVNDDGSVIYSQAYNPGKPFKIVSGKIYSTVLSNAVATSVYFNGKDPASKYFYYATQDATAGIYRFAATATNVGEVVERIYGGGTTADCVDDGKLVADACFASTMGVQTDSSGRLYVYDGSLINKFVLQRIRTIADGRVWTVAGVQGTAGVGGDRRSALFPRVDSIVTSSGGDAYISNGLGLSFLKVVHGSSTLASYLGNGNQRSNPVNGAAAAGQGISYSYWGGDASAIGFDNANSMFFFRAFTILNYIDGTNTMRFFGNTGSGANWQSVADDTVFPAATTLSPMSVNLGASNIAFNSSGDIFMSGGYAQTAADSGPRIIKLERSSGKLYSLAGATSADQATASLRGQFTADGQPAKGSSIHCAQNQAWYVSLSVACNRTLNLRVYADKLYYSEWNRIRVLDTTDGTDVLKTLRDGDNNVIADLVGPAGDFVIIGDRIYYNVTETNIPSKLYCRWKGTAATTPSDCTNTAVGPIGPMTHNYGGTGFDLRWGSGRMDVDGNGDILIAYGQQIYRYDVP